MSGCGRSIGGATAGIVKNVSSDLNIGFELIALPGIVIRNQSFSRNG